jgi:ATP-binding cassette subfamily B protein
MGMISQQLSRASASANRLFEVIDTENEIKERPDATPLDETIPGQVIFENVSFRYTGSNEDVLREISFTVEPGATVAILGATGSGKSTLVNLIPRFYDVTSGSVRIDGHDVRDVTLESLRQRVGVVLQEVNLVHGTIRENIAYGKPDATERQIKRVARAAQAHRFIEALPDGYHSMIGERGAGLSGGQRQRIAIARTLLVNPCVLIFDDSTSALDAETEYKIGRALAPLLAKQTAFIIAQRVSTARYADIIFVMEKGQIVARGRHEELLKTSPLYAEILYSQLEDDETTVGKEA